MSTIPEKEIESWTDFDDTVRNKSFRKWIYRGHTDASWDLRSSLFRVFTDVKKLTKVARGKAKKIARMKHEKVALDRFIATAHQYNIRLSTDVHELEWFAVMQHYGAPTRLLDFTFSPYVAAYFALESATSDAAVYCIRQEVFRENDDSFLADLAAKCREILDKDRKDFMFVYEPKYTTPRLLAQQGLFLVPGSLSVSHEAIIEEYELGRKDVLKLLIPRKLRADGIVYLRSLNITPTMLFPGIEGFCRSFRHQLSSKYNQKAELGSSKKTTN